jgi:hypothetical protein
VRLALTIPQLILRPRRYREGADRRSIIREYRMFTRLRAADQALTRGALGSRPLIVLTRGPEDDADAAGLWLAWRDLHRDLARLSANSRHIISGSSDHYLNTGDPELVISAIGEVVSSARARARRSGGRSRRQTVSDSPTWTTVSGIPVRPFSPRRLAARLRPISLSNISWICTTCSGRTVRT